MVDWGPIRRAIQLAGRHRTHPNPRVGAVVVNENGKVIGEGFHEGPGKDHAEVGALRVAGEAARGSDLFVSLEPCSFHGRTPPCVDSIISAGVRRVFVGAEDPDDRVSGSGVKMLRAAGIEVLVWESTDEAEAVDRAYFHHRRSGMPLVTLKYAMTLDGSVAALDGTSQWITSPEARRDAHLLRSTSDVVVVGAGTLRKDDPRLDVRIEGHSGGQPRPVILAGSKDLPTDRKVWSRDPIVVSTIERTIPSGELVLIEGEFLPDPVLTARMLADRGVLDVLVEGGPTVAASWWSSGVVNAGVVYVGSLMGGGQGRGPMAGIFESIELATKLDIVDVRMVGPDVRIEFA